MMKKLTPILVICALILGGAYWLYQAQSETAEPGYNAKFAKYLLKNDGKVPRAERRPSDWFYTQRAYPFDSIPMEQYLQALNKSKRMASSQLALGADAATWVESGPTNIPGRITDLAVDPSDQNTLYAACAAGGVFRSTNLGASWSPIFDNEGTPPIGAVAVDPTNPDVIYVGTGEVNPAGDTYEGTGLYKTTDGGLNWDNIGLPNSYRIGRIVIDPEYPDTVFVAVYGGRWAGLGPDRGVYRSTDGGANWSRVHYVADNVGCVDLAYHPSSGTVLAAMWQWFSGSGSAIWRSTDHGDNWTQLSSGDGLPSVSINASRIGLTMDPSSGTAYALYADGNGDFYGLYKSIDTGATWSQTSDGALSGLNASWSGGWYFGNIRVAPGQPDDVYALGLNVWRSTNGGASWSDISGGGPHVDQHAMYISPSDPDWILIGNDGGVYHSTTKGDTWSHLTAMPNTQFYAITVDYQNPERIYGGTQDNGSMRTSTGSLDDWTRILGGDGFYCVVDYTNPDIIYAEYQNGALRKSTDGGNTFSYALNGVDSDDPTNWNTPVVMDHTNPEVLYYGTNRLYKTTDGAENWTLISSYLTGGTITTIDVARSDPDVILVGCSDAAVWMTTDGGANWDPMFGLPTRYVTRVRFDHFDASVAYVTHSGYKQAGEFLPHIHRTDDYGANWTSIHGDLPDAPINDVVVDFHNDNTLYVGSDVGVFVTKDLGTTWTSFGTGMPITTIHSLAYHIPTSGLVAGTHGRSTFRTAIPCDDPTDTDGDGIGDDCDNCPGVANEFQEDIDYDFIGDACDPCTDTDGDGFGNPGFAANTCPDDNCPFIYNPDQTDTDGDGVGDICDMRATSWDTVSTTCTRLTIGNNGNFGRTGIGGANLDYAAFGDCNPSADVYVYDGSAVIAYDNGSEIIASNAAFGNQGFHLVDDLAETVPTTTTAYYDVYETGTMVTTDSALALEKTWWAPKQAENCHFVIQLMKVYSYDGAAHSGLYIGDAADWDIPTGDNLGGYDAPSGLVYQHGVGAGCQSNEERFGGMALIGWYLNDDTAAVDTTTPYGAFVKRNDTWVYPSGGFVPSELYSNMAVPGYSITTAQTDLHSVITYVGNATLDADDTLYIYAVLTTVQQGPLQDLLDNVSSARKWISDYLSIGSGGGCCGMYTGGYTGNANCDTEGKINLADISKLIDRVYLSKQELCCEENGNVNGDVEGKINLADISRAIDHVYLSKQPTEPCQ